MGNQNWGGSAYILTDALVRKYAGPELEALENVLEKAELDLGKLAQIENGVGIEYDEEVYAAEVEPLYQTLLETLKERTGLDVSISEVEEDWETDGQISVPDGYFWEVGNAVIPSPERAAFDKRVAGEQVLLSGYSYYG